METITINGAQIPVAELKRRGWSPPKVTEVWSDVGWGSSNFGARKIERGWVLLADTNCGNVTPEELGPTHGTSSIGVAPFGAGGLVEELERLIARIKEVDEQ